MKQTQNTAQTAARYPRLDEIRGLTLLSMMLYHFLWDLVFIAGVNIPWYTGTPGHIWQQSICWTFIFLSGFCWSLGRRQFKRGLTVFLSGVLVTIITLVFLPENRVVFGVLTLLGSSTLLLIPLDKLFSRIRNSHALTACLAAALLLFALFYPVNEGYIGTVSLPDAFYSGWFSTYLGFPMAGFYSTDYFSLMPWFFLFLSGYFCYRAVFAQSERHSNIFEAFSKFLNSGTIPHIHFLGKHSLPVYLLHQPVLYGITLFIMRVNMQP